MTDERDREKPPHPSTPDGYFNFPEGRGQVVFHDEEGNPMTPEQFDAYIERRERDLQKDEGKSE